MRTPGMKIVAEATAVSWLSLPVNEIDERENKWRGRIARDVQFQFVTSSPSYLRKSIYKCTKRGCE